MRRQLFWGSAWLIRLFLGQALEGEWKRTAQAALVLDAASTTLEKPDFREALIALAKEVAVRLSLRPASIGLEDRGSVRLAARCHLADLQRRSEAVQSPKKARDEALEKRCDQHHPAVTAAGTGQRRLALSTDHQTLVASEGPGGIGSVVLYSGGRAFGVLTLEYAADKGKHFRPRG